MDKIYIQYFDAHPEAKANVIAKGKVLLRNEWRASHRYVCRNGETRCWVCGEDWHAAEITRCAGFTRRDSNIEGTILREETLYAETVRRCRALVLARFKRPEDVTGEALAELYHTHGCDSSIVEDVLDCRLPESVHTQFMHLMDAERARSRAALKREIVCAKPATTN